MSDFTDIFIIYNPVSTGSGERNAKDLATQLKKALPASVNVETVTTQHAGHGKELAAKFAKEKPHCLIVSSSGDGGYHDVINGVLASGATTVVTGLLPSGNANDHYNAVHRGDLVERIAAGDVRHIDILAVDITHGDKKLRRYAHSYVGIGLTPHIGKALNETKLNPLSEAWLTLTRLFTNRSVKIAVDGTPRRYETLIFSNISRMAKVLSLSDDNSVSDGKFEVNGVRSSSRLLLIGHLLRASTEGLDENVRTDRFSFTCLQPMPIQLDGELVDLPRGAVCTVTCDPRRLACIV